METTCSSSWLGPSPVSLHPMIFSKCYKFDGCCYSRYTLLVYQQPVPTLDVSFLNLTDTRHFNITAFAERTSLGSPIAGTMFTVEVKDDAHFWKDGQGARSKWADAWYGWLLNINF